MFGERERNENGKRKEELIPTRKDKKQALETKKNLLCSQESYFTQKLIQPIGGRNEMKLFQEGEAEKSHDLKTSKGI